MILFKFSVAVTLFAIAHGHSRLSSPMYERKPYCGAIEECGPCKEPEKWAYMGFSEKNVAATWRRGQKVRYRYERNNHQKGFVRLSIIPMKYRMDFAAHEKYAFKYHCYAGPALKCASKDVCGSDYDGLNYYHDFVVPTTIPDGVYHFSWAWYGGGDHWDDIRRGYVTLYSCSIVKISGGDAVQASWPVSFEASKHERNAPGKCATHALRYTQCGKATATLFVPPSARFCPNRPEFQAVPPQFTQEGESPTLSITSQMFGASGATTTSAAPVESTVATTSKPVTITESVATTKKAMSTEAKTTVEKATTHIQPCA